jgi:hypothetical protein
MKEERVRVYIKYEWDFDLSEWGEAQANKSQIENITKKIEWDHISIFHHLNDITYPDAVMEIKAYKKSQIR